MKYSNELKVGTAILAAVAIFYFGVRYFKDIPLFTGSYELSTQLVDAKGLIPGNPVRTNGVKVGSIKAVTFDQQAGLVDVVFRINKGIVLPEGTVCTVTGIDAITGIRLELKLGPLSNPPIKSGGIVPNESSGDVVADLVGRAPVLVNRVDSVLVGLDATLGSVQGMIGSPDSDLNAVLRSLRGSAASLNRLLASEQQRISSILANVEQMSGDISGLTATQSDSIARSVQLLNVSLESLTRSMNSLEGTTAQLDTIVGKIDSGTGTLGMLVNNPGLYNKLDSLAGNLNLVLGDFKSNPRRYLRELKIVDIF